MARFAVGLSLVPLLPSSLADFPITNVTSDASTPVSATLIAKKKEMTRPSLILFLTLFLSAVMFAQAPGTGSTDVPLPGVGHDYIKALSETVDPASGSVSLRISVPIPKGRGLDLPFNFAYDSNGVIFPPNWQPFLTGLMSNGGWSYTVPALGEDAESYVPGGTNVTCGYDTNFRFTDASGARRGLGLFVMVGTNPACAASDDNFANGDIAVRASYSTSGGVVLADADGTVYKNFSGFSNGDIAGLIEDRNGNQIKIAATGATGVFTETDTLGRTVLSSSGFGVTGNTLTVSGLGASYKLSWESSSYNFTMGTNLVFDGGPYGCTFSGSTGGNRSVIESIQLPNGQSYSFKHGTDDPNNSNPYGLISQITYPSGGWIKYSWGLNSESAGGVFPDVQGEVGQCYWRWDKPSLQSRIISFDGVNPALEQTYQYSTTWGSTGNTGSYLWSSKQTTVTTQDLVRGTSFVTTYSYTPQSISGEPIPLYLGASWTVDPQVPVEQTITYKETGGATLETVNKNWYNGEQLQWEKDAFGTETSERIYTYGSGGQLTDEKDYDYGNNAPGNLLRETVTNHQAFGNTPIYPGSASIFDRPCQTIIYDGGGNRAAETDYFYDNGATTSTCGNAGIPSVAGVSNLVSGTHDETNYGSSSTAPRGNLTAAVKQCFQGTTACATGNLTTTYTYDKTGQVLSMTEPNQATTQYSYADSYTIGTPSGNTNAYLTKITYPPTSGVNHIENFSYGYPDGQLTVSKDENGNSTTYDYSDTLDRLTETDFPDNGVTQNIYNDTASPPNMQVNRLISNSLINLPVVWLTTQTNFDGLGHIIKHLTTSDPSGTDNVDTVYDGLGRVLSRSNSYRTTSDQTYGVTTYTYDALGRITLEVDPRTFQTSKTYTNRAVEVVKNVGYTDAITHIYQNDALGRLTSICEVTGTWTGANGFSATTCPNMDISGTGVESTITYDALGNILTMEQSGKPSEERIMTYDGLSRLLTMALPEVGTFASPGNTITYTYDTATRGDLYQKTSPLPNSTATGVETITYSYDALHRLTGESYTGIATPALALYYDQSSTPANWPNNLGTTTTLTNPKGRLSMMQLGGGIRDLMLGYDKMGRVSQYGQCSPTNCTAGIGSWSTFNYDYIGDVLNGNDPDNSATSWTNTYNSIGQLQSIYLSNLHKSGSTPVPGYLVQALSYNALGLLVSNTLGTGETESWQWTANGQPTNHSVGTNCPNTPCTYNWAGTWGINMLQSAKDAQIGYAQYSYDAFGNLSTAQNTTTGNNFSYSYDQYGNRWSQTATAGSGPQPYYTFTSGSVSDSNHINPIYNVTYDIAGNMIYDGIYYYAYDGNNRVVSIGTSPGSNNAGAYIYNSRGERVSTNSNGGGVVEWLTDIDGHVVEPIVPGSTGFYSDELFIAGRDWGTKASGTTNFRFADFNGNGRVWENYAGTPVQTCSTLPFGDGSTCNATPSYPMGIFGDTNIYDTNSNTYHTPNREQSLTQGRWLIPDLADADDGDPEPLPYSDLSDPQTWNLYSYVRNNPVNDTDPDGHACVQDSGGDWHDDNSGGQTCAQAAVPASQASATVSAPPPTSHELMQADGISPLMLGPGDVAANNGPSWWGAFAKNLFSWKNFTAEFKQGGCVNVFGSATAGALNPFSPSLSSAGEGTAAVLAASKYNAAVQYAASAPNYLGGTGLIYPMKSSVVRSMVADANATAASGGLMTLDLALAQGFGTEMYSMATGGCH